MKINPRLCLLCRASKYLCGLSYCPILVNLNASKVRVEDELRGTSPPSVFVGRFNYPKVRIYPSSPPERGDTSIYENPREWINMSLSEFLILRTSLVRGGREFRVEDPLSPCNTLQEIQLLSMSSKPVDIEMEFEGKVRNSIVLDENLPPFGPSGLMRRISIQEPRLERIVEKAYYDNSMKSSEAILRFYEGGISVERISRMLSTGSIGIKRKLVPTRWSITATDKAISDHLLREVKQFREIDKYEVRVRKFLDNLFISILTPSSYFFEWGEAWFPRTTWNYFGKEHVIEVDYEGFKGKREEYPSIGGCYYASRLAVLEHLRSRKRSSGIILWREIYPPFNIPVGVWFVRENIRKLMNEKAIEFDSIDLSLEYVSKFTKCSISDWIGKSIAVRTLKGRTLDSKGN
jgi:hypothetical protein